MQIGVYRKNVMQTLQIKPAKIALKLTAKNTQRTALIVSVTGLNVEIGELMNVLNPYICGLQMTQQMRADAFDRFGEVAYYLTMASRVLKVKLPTASKRSRLSGTRTAALLQFHHLANDMLSIVASALQGPKMKTVEKMVVLPKQGGKKEIRPVLVLDKEAEDASFQERLSQYRGLITALVDLFWRLTFDMFQTAPAAIFDASMEGVQKRIPAPRKKFVPGKEAHPSKPAPAKAKKKAAVKTVPPPVKGTLHLPTGKPPALSAHQGVAAAKAVPKKAAKKK